MHELYELKEQLLDELIQYRSKQKKSMDDITVIKYLSSAIDHMGNILKEAEEMGYSERGNYSRGYSRNMGDNRYAYEGNRGNNRGGSSRKGAMDRYSRDGGYSRADGMEDLVETVRSMMQELPQNVQQDAQRFVQKLEQQM